jgi:predicted dehydrogenase
MAQQLCSRFPIGGHYSDLETLLRQAKPDVVHITTPPGSHFALAKYCLESGCHVYVEKPFTLYADEASELIALANRNNLKITAGHDNQFTHVARRMRALVQGGILGGDPIHMESYYCYELGRSEYAGALLGDKEHWVRKLPGKLLQNIISHGIARIAEFFPANSPTVIAHGFVSPLLKSIEEREIIDELRVIISDDERTTAYFTFSTQMRPSLRHFRIFGPRNGLELDHDQETLTKLRGSRYKSYAEKFVPPLDYAWQYFQNLHANAERFLANDFHMKSGMKYLVESFYTSIVHGTPPPIPYREIQLTAVIMEQIFRQLSQAQSKQWTSSGLQLSSRL